MPRSINSVASKARRKKILKQAKGYFGRRKNVYTVAKNAVEKALSYAYRDRKTKKRNFRALWIQRINAGAREHGMSYSQFMGLLKKSNIDLNRKVLIVVSKKTDYLKLSTRNVKNVELISASNLNTLSLIKATQILTTPAALNEIKEIYCG